MRAKGKKPAPVRSGAAALSLVERVDALAEVLRRHELNEIEVEESGVRIYVRRGAPEAPPVAPPPLFTAAPVAAPSPPMGSPAVPSTPSTDTSDGNVAYVTSPFVGTFYRASSPDSAPFVDAGTRVRKGQLLCIVEAMKLMNEIECEIEGTIVQILVENGQAVEYGEPLFKIKQG